MTMVKPDALAGSTVADDANATPGEAVARLTGCSAASRGAGRVMASARVRGAEGDTGPWSRPSELGAAMEYAPAAMTTATTNERTDCLNDESMCVAE